MKAEKWIDRVKAARGWDSDYRVAKELGITRQAVSNYRSRTPTLDEESSMKVAHALGINPALVLADQAMERTKNDEAKHAWFSILERLGGVAAAALLTVGLGVSPAPANAAQGGDSVYIMLINVSELMP